jgi:hypothetical protein
MIGAGVPETGHAFSNLVDGLCPPPNPPRVDLVIAAVRSANAEMRYESLCMLMGWQRQQRLDDRGKQLLFELLQDGDTKLCHFVINECSYWPPEQSVFCIEVLQRVIQLQPNEHLVGPLLSLVDRMEGNSSPAMSGDLVAKVLKHLVPVADCDDAMEQYHLEHLSNNHPREIFYFYRQRVEHCRILGEGAAPFDPKRYQPLPKCGARVTLQAFAKTDEFDAEFARIRVAIVHEMRGRTENDPQAKIYDRGGYFWHLRQLACWMLRDAWSKYPAIVDAWIPLLATEVDVAIFESIAVGESARLALHCPQALSKLLGHVDTHVPSVSDDLQKSLRLSVCRFIGTSGSPRWRRLGDSTPDDDEDSINIIDTVAKLLHAHMSDPTLKQFYERLQGECQKMLALHRKVDRSVFDEDEDLE